MWIMNPSLWPQGKQCKPEMNTSQAADENAESRVLAGIHFRFACEAGQQLGNKIGKWTVEKYLRPLE